MKPILYIITVLLLTSIAFADFRVDQIKFYVDDELESGADEDGGDIEVEPDSLLDIIFTLENDLDNETEARIDVIIRDIDDGDDIDKDLSWFTIQPNDDKKKTISFIIPEDADEDTYDLEIDIDYKYKNGTQKTWEENYDLEVVEKREKDEVDDVQLSSILNNMTSVCSSMVSSVDECFGYIGRADTCMSELSTVKEERGTFKATAEECTLTRAQYITEKDDLTEQVTNLESQIQQKDNEIQNRVTKDACESDKTKAVTDAEEALNRNHMIIAGIAVVGFVIYNNRKKKETVGGQYYYERK